MGDERWWGEVRRDQACDFFCLYLHTDYRAGRGACTTSTTTTPSTAPLLDAGPAPAAPRGWPALIHIRSPLPYLCAPSAVCLVYLLYRSARLATFTCRYYYDSYILVCRPLSLPCPPLSLALVAWVIAVGGMDVAVWSRAVESADGATFGCLDALSGALCLRRAISVRCGCKCCVGRLSKYIVGRQVSWESFRY